MSDTIKIFPEGTELICKSDISKSYKIVIIPHSVKCIEDYSFKEIPCDVFYIGTIDEFDKIEIHDDICVPRIICVDGLKMLHL